MLYIRNSGEVEEEALCLIGASSKEGDETKIGFFGSGNKYAIATLLRNNIPFKIYSGLNEMVITVETVNFRGQSFDRILVNGKHTSLTTRMGPQWEVWFAIREFICNAKDEGGYELSTEELTPQEGTTLIIISHEEVVRDFVAKKTDYFIEQEEGEKLTDEVFFIPGSFNIYRKGICVKPAGMNFNALGAYNFNTLGINESRVISSIWDLKNGVGRAILETENESYIRRVLYTAFRDENSFEAQVYFNYAPSTVWRDVLQDKSIAPYPAAQFMAPEDRGHYVWVPSDLAKRLAEAYSELRVWGYENEVGWVEDPGADKSRHARIIKALKQVGLIDEFPNFRLGHFNDTQVQAVYVKKLNEVWFRDEEDEELVATVYEEYCHTKGYDDGSRNFEAYLIKELLHAKGIWSSTDIDNILSTTTGYIPQA